MQDAVTRMFHSLKADDAQQAIINQNKMDSNDASKQAKSSDPLLSSLNQDTSRWNGFTSQLQKFTQVAKKMAMPVRAVGLGHRSKPVSLRFREDAGVVPAAGAAPAAPAAAPAAGAAAKPATEDAAADSSSTNPTYLLSPVDPWNYLPFFSAYSNVNPFANVYPSPLSPLAPPYDYPQWNTNARAYSSRQSERQHDANVVAGLAHPPYGYASYPWPAAPVAPAGLPSYPPISFEGPWGTWNGALSQPGIASGSNPKVPFPQLAEVSAESTTETKQHQLKPVPSGRIEATCIRCLYVDEVTPERFFGFPVHAKKGAKRADLVPEAMKRN